MRFNYPLKVVRIRSLGHCGSTLLNILLDSVGGIRGLSELPGLIYRARSSKRVGTKCFLCSPDICHFYKDIDIEKILSSCRELYSEAQVLIDSSKLEEWYLIEQEQNLEYFDVVLFKWPHEKKFHDKKTTYNAAMTAVEIWSRHYESVLRNLEGRSYLVLHYRSLVENPGGVVEKVLESIGYWGDIKEEWWETDTHMVGGAGSVLAQVNKNHLQGFWRKCPEKYHQVYVDSFWRTQKDYLREIYFLYRLNYCRVMDLAGRLGFSDEMLMSEVEDEIEKK